MISWVIDCFSSLIKGSIFTRNYSFEIQETFLSSLTEYFYGRGQQLRGFKKLPKGKYSVLSNVEVKCNLIIKAGILES